MSDDLRTVDLTFEDQEELQKDYETNLKSGRAFAHGITDLEVFEEVSVVLHRPDSDHTLTLPGRVVLVQSDPPGEGAGLELTIENGETLDRFVRGRFTSIRPETTHGRIRKLTGAQAVKLARTANLEERVMLERIFGKTVWDVLLQNPRMTIPEVARIAKKGTVPRITLETIVNNNTWLAAGPVRRALLTNPRLAEDSIMKVIRMMPAHERKLLGSQRGYSMAVRAAAKKLMGKG
ncbi:MAG: hypothetical protein KC416_16420 [Myxococcales bacterium]|nr:hypothetical protein [Myxococcales bacterium]